MKSESKNGSEKELEF